MRDFLTQHGISEPAEQDAILDRGRHRRAAAGEILFWGERVFGELWYVERGLLRAYRLIEGQDFTYFFFPQQQFAVDFQSFLSRQPSPLLFEALTEAELRIFPRAAIYDLYEAYPRFERLGRLMAEQAYLSAAERLKQFQTDDLETRYTKLVARHPELFQAVPQHYIASYLGVKPQSLSRIRARLAERK